MNKQYISKASGTNGQRTFIVSATCHIIVSKNTVKGKVTESSKTSDALNARLVKASDIEIEIVEAWR